MANIRMLDVNGNPYNSFEGQLALSHTYGSGKEDSLENTAWSVSDYLYGLQIDHYASISMDKVVRDFYGRILGRYDSNQDVTRDFYGRIVSKGDTSSGL